ncbi:NUDIX domain-containing protein [Kitasatospora sp. NPDC086009]|uniref:NUDIX domain-containing protein n=1 Tax=unclassified Kitasatospora TaxID=2633591 RepID=UPI0037C86744
MSPASRLLAITLTVPALSAGAAALACRPIRDGPLTPRLLVFGLILTTGVVAGLPTAYTWRLPPPPPQEQAVLYPLPDILTNPPRRRLGHQTLALDPDGAVLLVATTYQNGLTLPGGSAERNELPHLAARRHTETETGLVLPLRSILATDYTDARLLPEAIDFVYWGGRLTRAQQATTTHHRPPHHITGLHFIHPDHLADTMDPDQHHRVTQALDALTRGAHLPFLLRGIPAE